MDFLHYPYASKRNVVVARNGMVATSQPLAAQAGLTILQRDGNAVDAAIATAAALTVTEPTSNGIGGDAFAIVWMNNEIFSINGSGPAPAALSIDALQQRGFTKIPAEGVVPITVPGVPATWAALSKRFGKLPLLDVLQPAITYAEEGFPLSPTLTDYWQRAYNRFKDTRTAPEFQAWFETFSVNGGSPQVGDMWRSPGHARTLRLIGETNGEAFYRGELADEIDAFLRAHNGFLTKDDLASFEPEWVEPIKTNYRGYDVWEIPPNGQGIVAQMALNIYENKAPSTDAHDVHVQIEAMKLAYADALANVTERTHMPVTTEQLLSKDNAKARFDTITDEAATPTPSAFAKGGTVYLATADRDGNMVSFIQSNYMGFGSGVVVPNTGIALQNRGHDFSMDESHPNVLRPKKRTYHTIIPGFLTKDGEAIAPFGVMGAYMQPQGHFQVLRHMIDFDLNPQAALDAPRWQWIHDKTVHVEAHFPLDVVRQLQKRGHDVHLLADSGTFGRGQIIWRNPDTGVLYGGTEPRTDGAIASY